MFARRKLLPILAASLMAFSASSFAAYPERPVKIVVPNAPGGPVDVTVRLLATELSKKWGQAVVVENRPGASGMMTGSVVASSPADGYVLGTMLAATMTIVPFAVDKMPFDPLEDLAPVTMLARVPFMFIVAKNSPLKTWHDFIAASKQRDLTIGSYSIGTSFHLSWEQIAKQAGIKAVYAPSSSPGRTQGDLISGRIDIALEALSSAKGLMDGDRVRALAITSSKRFPTLPDVPTLIESGLEGYSAEPWFSLMARKGTPDEIVNKIQQDVAEALSTPGMRRQMELLGQEPVGSTPSELAETIRTERATMGSLVKSLGIRLQ